jgi:peptide-methionine (R)-S-oxide reductase
MTKHDLAHLSEEARQVTQEKSTEAPFSGKLLHNKDTGMYTCAVCGQELFSSETKFDSGSGWPSFYDVAHNNAVTLQEDSSHGMNRTEVTCTNCGAHLGHIFPDAPDTLPDGRHTTGQRYCVNSAALEFIPTQPDSI